MNVVSALDVPSFFVPVLPACTSAPAWLTLTRRSFSRLPSCGASTVMNSAAQPSASALRTMRSVFSRSALTYSWKKSGWRGAASPPAPPAAATMSSRPHDDSVGIMKMTPSAPAASFHATSPSGWPSLHIATADRYTGSELAWPRMRVRMSMLRTLTITRGRSHSRWYAEWFSRSVISSSAPLE